MSFNSASLYCGLKGAIEILKKYINFFLSWTCSHGRATTLCWLSLAFIIDCRVVPDLWPLRQAKVENDRGNPFPPALLMAILLCNTLSPQNGLFSRRFNRKTRIEGSRAFLPKLPKKRMSYDVCLYWVKKWQFFLFQRHAVQSCYRHFIRSGIRKVSVKNPQNCT